jgi:hypothetical protein
VDVEELEQVFSRFGVIAESLESDAPRIKLYNDENGNFRGEALIGMSRAYILRYIDMQLLNCDSLFPPRVGSARD